MSPKEELVPAKHRLWLEDLEEGKGVALKEGKPLLVAYLGLPWCPWSEKMELEVLSQEAFAAPMREKFVLVSLNIAEESEEAHQVKVSHGITELPTLLLMQADGQVITKLPFLPKGASEFAEHIASRYETYQKVRRIVDTEDLSLFSAEELKELYLKSKELGIEDIKERLFGAGLALDSGLFFLLEQYRHMAERGKQGSKEGEAVRKKIVARDPKNAAGAFRSLALLDFEALSLKKSKKEKHIKAALNPLIDYVQKFGPQDRENLWKMELLIAQFLYGKNRLSEALLHAKSAYNHTPDAHLPQVKETLSFLEAKAQQASSK